MDSTPVITMLAFSIAGIAVFLMVVYYFIAKANLEILRKEKDDEISKLESTLSSIQAQLKETDRLLHQSELRRKQLEPYSIILDVEQEAKSILQQANDTASNKIAVATIEASNLRNEAKQELSEAKAKANQIADKSQQDMNEKLAHAEQIVQSAKEQAQKIAGSALEAKEKAELWDSAAKAARNIIQGYGDEYVVPNLSALDALAEDFSHKEAGIELKKARNYTKELIKQGQASTCSYVENNRKETAERFVLDAYNGKVDSTLSSVKHSNYGKLQQQIEDAFVLVNYNGAAFRDAHITGIYHRARLNELKWAVAAMELQMLEREEQKAIREQMREEEKARKEYEKAMRDTEKEERILQSALEKARRELAGAAEAQKAQFEAELLALQEKLSEAELRNQRALSMAQQTRRGHVYVISNVGSFGEDVFKVGMTRRLEPADRIRELGDASVPFSFDIHAMIYSEDAPSLEKELHRQFSTGQVNKVNPRKEFFRVSLSDIKQAVQHLGIEAHWTMKAEAAEYHETLAIERALKNNTPLPHMSTSLPVH